MATDSYSAPSFTNKYGYWLLDLTKVSLPHYTAPDGGSGVVDYGNGVVELPLDKVGDDLVIEYNGTWDANHDEYSNAKNYTIKNYFKTNGKSNIKIKIDCYNSDGTLHEKGKVFDLKEIVKVMIGFENSEKGSKIDGTFLRDDIDGSKGNDTIYGNAGDDTIYGLEGNDVIYGGDGDDHIWGNEGNDKLYGGKGHNTFYFSEGSGHDAVYSTKGAEDTLVFENIDDIEFESHKYDNHLTIKYGDGEDRVTIADYFKNPDTNSVKYVKLGGTEAPEQSLADLLASKPEVINGSDGDDTIKGSHLASIITGGKGDDKLYGGKGKNTFVFSDGDGNDTLYYESGEDIIDLRNVENLNLFGTRNGSVSTEAEKQGNDLIIKYTSTLDEGTNEDKYDTIRLVNYFKNGEKSDIKVILRNDDYGNPIYTDIKDFVSVDLTFDDATKGKKITGTFLNDLIDGTDYNDVIRGGKGNDDIYGGWGNDKLYGESGDNVFEFDVSHFYEDGNVIFKGDGNDTIYSGKGNDLITFAGTSVPTGNVDEFGEPETRAMTVDDLKFSLKGNSLVIHYTDKDSIELADYIKLKGKHSVKEVEMEDGTYTIEELVAMHPLEINGKENKKNSLKGTFFNDVINGGKLADTIKGGDGDDTIFGGTGNDKLYGEGGNNIFKFSLGDGKDTIYSGKGNDTIKFDDSVAREDVVLTKSGNNLILQYSENDSITISNYFKKNADCSVHDIMFNNESPIYFEGYVNSFINSEGEMALEYAKKINNSKKSIGETIRGSLLNDTITGSKGDDFIQGERGHDVINGGNGNDTLYGGSGNDTIKGGNGDDIIYGNTGNDKLYGEGGNNKIIFSMNDGNDTVYMGKGNDELMFGEHIFDNIHYKKSGNHLVIKYGENDSVTVNNYFSSKTKSVDKITHMDDANNLETTINSYSLKNDIIISKSEGYDVVDFGDGYEVPADCYEGNGHNNLIVANNNKKLNFVEAGAGDDMIYCQGKQVIAKGGSGNDTYVVSSLKNLTGILDESGSDTVQIADKSSNVNLIFNVSTNNHLDDYTGMYILNKSTLSGLVKSKDLANIKSGVEIDEFFNNAGDTSAGAIERIETKNGYVTLEQINEVKANVASWLSEKGYSSALEALAVADKSSVNELVAIYQQIDWQPLEA